MRLFATKVVTAAVAANYRSGGIPAIISSFSRSNIPLLILPTASFLSLSRLRFLCIPFLRSRSSFLFSRPFCTSPLTMTSDSGAGELMEKQFEEFKMQLEESGGIRDQIKAVVMEMESSIRLMQSSILLVHQSLPIPQILERAGVQISVLKELYQKLAGIMRECPGQYYRYHGDWKSETQNAVSLIAFLHWLETGSLLKHTEAEEKLGLVSSEFDLDIEDYLVGLCFMSNEMPRYVVNRVTAGDFDCPKKVLPFITDLHASFRMLNLRNDFLRKKFDSLKYDVRRIEEVFYDVKIRGLAAPATDPNQEQVS